MRVFACLTGHVIACITTATLIKCSQVQLLLFVEKYSSLLTTGNVKNISLISMLFITMHHLNATTHQKSLHGIRFILIEIQENC